jgi:hypothetical protein
VHPDGFPGELVPAVEDPDPRQSDAVPWAPNAWDAWDGAHQDVAVGAVRQHPLLLAAADVGRWVVPEPGGPVPDAQFRQLPQLANWALTLPDGVAAPCTRDAGPSAEQSCAARAFAGLQVQPVSSAVACLALMARPKP